MSSYGQTLGQWDKNTALVSNTINTVAGTRSPLVLANPNRIYLAINVWWDLAIASTYQLFPIGAKSASAYRFSNLLQVIEFQIWKHFSLCTCQWDFLAGSANIEVNTFEVLYRGP